MSMIKPKFAAGDPVRITSGTYKDAEGVVQDIQPECSAVRIQTPTGTAYGLLGEIVKIVSPMRMPTKKSLRR